MKIRIDKLGLPFTFLFIMAMVFNAYYLYIFPTRLNKKSIKVDHEVLDQLSTIFTELNLVVFGTFATALIALMFQLISQRFNRSSGHSASGSTAAKMTTEQEKTANSEAERQQHSMDTYQSVLKEGEDIKRNYNKVLWTVCKKFEVSQAAMYRVVVEADKRFIELTATFAYSIPDSKSVRFEFGDGLAGQAAKEGSIIHIQDVPDGYIKVVSGLGSSSPSHLLILPLKKEDKVVGVMELASFNAFENQTVQYLTELGDMLAQKLEIEVKSELVESDQEN